MLKYLLKNTLNRVNFGSMIRKLIIDSFSNYIQVNSSVEFVWI